jgi:hypothetical protein
MYCQQAAQGTHVFAGWGMPMAGLKFVSACIRALIRKLTGRP